MIGVHVGNGQPTDDEIVGIAAANDSACRWIQGKVHFFGQVALKLPRVAYYAVEALMTISNR